LCFKASYATYCSNILRQRCRPADDITEVIAIADEVMDIL
jgi:hypothetical protein